MFRKSALLACAAIFICLSAHADHPIMGIWEGKCETGPYANKALTAYVVGLDKNQYRISLLIGPESEPEFRCELSGMAKREVLVAVGETDFGVANGGIHVISLEAADGRATGKIIGKKDSQQLITTFELSKVYRRPPSLGERPPEGALVLFDGVSYDEWNLLPGFVSDGTLKIVSKNTFVSKKEFGDCKIHIEFCPPYMPEEPTGAQSRGNSGVYVQGRYEVQVLDSFAEPPADNYCGGIYKIATPKVNASLPPGEWQTYDITFYAPRFDATGKKIKNAEITVYHNGTLIHDKLELPHPTPGGISDTEAKTGPLFLQNHGDAVQYRNIWVLPLESAQ